MSGDVIDGANSALQNPFKIIYTRTFNIILLLASNKAFRRFSIIGYNDIQQLKKGESQSPMETRNEVKSKYFNLI